jgi:predicted phosphodiesterase
MQFQVLSDIHLEMRDGTRLPRIPVAAQTLILAGDIGIPSRASYSAFLRTVAAQFRTVLLIAGNHEYFRGRGTEPARSMEDTEALIRAHVSSLPNVVYLQNEVYHVPDTDVSVFGSTFWTDIATAEEPRVLDAVTDYVAIDGFTPDACRALHGAARAALRTALEATPGRRWVVVSHHMPSLALVNPRFAGAGFNSAFASDVPEAHDDRVVAWVYGHTHVPSARGKFLCNPIGYPGEISGPCWDVTMAV